MALIKRNTAYSLNDIVNTKYGTKLKCTTAGTTSTDPLILDGTSPITDGTVVWEVQEEQGGSGQGLVDYAPNTSYNVGDIVIYDDKIYKCITAHTSTSTFDTTKWEEISSSDKGLSIWQANTYYNIDDIVIDSNLIWQCATAHTSTSIFDESKWVCISGGEISNGLEIVPLWEGSYSFSNSTNTPTSSTPMMELNDSINNYEYFYVEAVDSVFNNICSSIIRPKDFNHCYRVGFFATGGYFLSTTINFYDSYNVYLNNTDSGGYPLNTCYITSIQGIRKAKPIVSSGMKYETLWEGEAGSISSDGSNITINLSESITKYKKLGLNLASGVTSAGGRERWHYEEIDVAEFLNFITSSLGGLVNKFYSYSWGFGSNTDSIDFTQNSTSTSLNFNYSSTKITKVIGISEGVVVPTGVQAARVTLFEGSATSTVTLSDDYTNYDVFEMTGKTTIGASQEIFTSTFSKQDIDNMSSSNRLIIAVGYGSLTNCIEFVGKNGTNNLTFGADNSVLTKIVGIKYIQPDSYSTEEKLIGTWIDGKPLYRKVFTGTAPSSAGVNTNIFTDPLFTNVDMCYVKDGYIKRDAGSGDIDFYTINENMDSAYSSRIFISCSESSIRGAVGQQLISRPLVVIVEYTKTTD